MDYIKLKKKFDTIRKMDWNTVFIDTCTQNWHENWFIDGLRADVKNTDDGMILDAGAVAHDHACHAVLWTKQEFAGDLKIEFSFTRLDTMTRWVNILYIQAMGIGESPYNNDITQWNNLRTIPYMRTYFEKMKLLHVSYAAFDNSSDDPEDYIRARLYPVRPGCDFETETMLDGELTHTGMFEPGIVYHCTAFKTGTELLFEVSLSDGSGAIRCGWELPKQGVPEKGRIGLRQMWTRCSMYKDFKVSITR